ncbi:unnamed protein product [Rangifer tarandus platyrhynchus]|uniref:Uncharacterized protein n=1 Tax=Rangifer tarandus platyrhynchus TaxID=3082113 RepID=A0AC60A556_RANTA
MALGPQPRAVEKRAGDLKGTEARSQSKDTADGDMCSTPGLGTKTPHGLGLGLQHHNEREAHTLQRGPCAATETQRGQVSVKKNREEVTERLQQVLTECIDRELKLTTGRTGHTGSPGKYSVFFILVPSGDKQTCFILHTNFLESISMLSAHKLYL